MDTDLSDRQVIFTINDIEPVVDSEYPPAHVWCGHDGGGSFERLLPILFTYCHSELDGPYGELEQFSLHGDFDDKIKTMVYTQGTSGQDPMEVAMKYHISVLPAAKVEDEIGIRVTSREDVWESASVWEDSYATRSLRTRQSPAVHGGYNKRIRFAVYSKPFKTTIPIFNGIPDEQVLRDELRSIKIPCVVISDDLEEKIILNGMTHW
jgi:hypothetical protein